MGKLKVGDRFKHEMGLGIYQVCIIEDGKYYTNLEKTHWFLVEQDDELIVIDELSK